MSDIINDGGPAFPCPSGSDGGSLYDGMTLRDWFAGMALQAMISNSGLIDQYPGGGLCEMLAKNSYLAADAMLAQREKKP